MNKKLIILIVMSMLVITTTGVRADMCSDFIVSTQDQLFYDKQCRDAVKSGLESEMITTGAWIHIPACEQARAKDALRQLKWRNSSPTLLNKCIAANKTVLEKLASESKSLANEITKYTTPNAEQAAQMKQTAENNKRMQNMTAEDFDKIISEDDKKESLKKAEREKERELKKKKEEDIMVDNCVKSHTTFNCESLRSNFKKKDSKDGVSVRKTINP